MLTKIKKQAKWVKTFLMINAMLALPSLAFASATGAGSGTARTWPWTAFFLSLMKEFTGPLPTTLGAFGICFVAYSLYSGRGEFGKSILLIIAVSLCLVAPTLIGWMTSDATGLMIGGI